ncbi:hypothetical protein WA026_015447 [Henosepilachna vigintioctopunctata]|uniref:Reverse transcriptase n=1 Tax=Henosepilachna vigintioctopunctata TaxID=420089 RepID=A0AAW1ULZ2_9CUCU
MSFLYTVGNGRLPGVRWMARRRTIRDWQERWDRIEDKAQWTKRLIPDIGGWVDCKFRTTNYYFTEFLTGHGSYFTYTCRIKKTRTDLCGECEVPDSPEHTIFSCKRWSNERKAAWKKLGRVVNADTLLGEMMKTREKWRAGYEYIVDIMKRKEVEDRMRQQEEGNNME